MAIVFGIGREDDHEEIATFLNAAIRGGTLKGCRTTEDDQPELIFETVDGRTIEIDTCGCCGGLRMEVKDPSGRSH